MQYVSYVRKLLSNKIFGIFYSIITSIKTKVFATLAISTVGEKQLDGKLVALLQSGLSNHVNNEVC